jgi:hypothetical protein
MTIYLGNTSTVAMVEYTNWFTGKVPCFDSSGNPDLAVNGLQVWITASAINGGDGVYTASISKSGELEAPIQP